MKKNQGKILSYFFACVLFCLIFVRGAEAKEEQELFPGIKARSLGPAGMSGRIAAIDVVVSNPCIIYVGSSTGGVWKSVNEGITWKPIFDNQPTSSIGAVAVCRSNPNTVWVGTGESLVRNSSGVGRGVFKSQDGGKTWTKVGLEKTENISRIILHPTCPGTAYVAALGTSWGENAHRGIFKTTDGGQTWEKILFVDNKTGAADLVMAPGNPNLLIAAMWEHRRWPWFFKSGGSGSGIYISTDEGKYWKKLTPEKNGIPKGELGRIGVAFGVNKPSIVYAIVEAKKSVILRSEDSGFNWKTVNSKTNISDRPFYYSVLKVNPKNENIVYAMQTALMVSEDGGKNFRSMVPFRRIHSDHHTMWIHPDGEFMVEGNDGGIAISRNRGKNWRFIRNLPLSQFYHSSFDMDFPYNIYGGLQDNGSWVGPSTSFSEAGAIFNHDWTNVGDGDGFATEPDPEKSSCGYSMAQTGYLQYFNFKTGLFKSIRPTETDVKHRYNWNAGLAIDPFEPGTIYYGSQFLHRSRDRGNSWEIISPDLTTNDPKKQKQDETGGLTLDVSGAENHTTILTIAPSPVKKGIIWVGTDDGCVQVTRDNGKSWKKVSTVLTGGRKPRVPEGTWVPHVEASKFDSAACYVVFDDHRRANWKPYAFVTHDFGKTWRNIIDSNIDGFVHIIEEDPVNKDLLFLGTEFGLYVSFNGGKEWMKWTNGIPTVPVRGLGVHPREHDLVIGTHGRGIYILDDISPLRQVNRQGMPAFRKKKLHLFDVQDAYQYRQGYRTGYHSPGDTAFMGRNREYGALISYYLLPDEKSDSKDEKKIKIEILNKKSEVIRELNGPKKKGVNRIAWDLCRRPFKSPVPKLAFWGEEVKGPLVLPGTYKVRIKHNDMAVEKPIVVKSDPRIKMDPAVLKTCYDMTIEVGALLESVEKAYKTAVKTRKSIKIILDFVDVKEKKNSFKVLIDGGKKLDKKLKEFVGEILPDPDIQGFPNEMEKLGIDIEYGLLELIMDSYEPLTQAIKVKLKKIKTRVKELFKDFNEINQKDVAEFQKKVKSSGFSLFEPFKSFILK